MIFFKSVQEQIAFGKQKLSEVTRSEKISILYSMVATVEQADPRIAETMRVSLGEADRGNEEALTIAEDRILGFLARLDSTF